MMLLLALMLFFVFKNTFLLIAQCRSSFLQHYVFSLFYTLNVNVDHFSGLENDSAKQTFWLMLFTGVGFEWWQFRHIAGRWQMALGSYTICLEYRVQNLSLQVISKMILTQNFTVVKILVKYSLVQYLFTAWKPSRYNSSRYVILKANSTVPLELLCFVHLERYI